MRKKGDISYGEDAKKMLLSLLNEPKSIAELTREMQLNFFDKIHYYTVKRLLKEIEEEGILNSKKIGKIRIWWRD